MRYSQRITRYRQQHNASHNASHALRTIEDASLRAIVLDGSGGGTVLNYGEVLGRSLYFKAEGSFKPAKKQSSPDRCPQDFNVAIREGGFVAGGKPFVSSAISGPGFLRCLYIDEDIRIFESPKDSPDRWEEAGLVVVQVRDALFDDPVDGDL